MGKDREVKEGAGQASGHLLLLHVDHTLLHLEDLTLLHLEDLTLLQVAQTLGE